MKKTEIKLSEFFSKNRIKIYFMSLVCSAALLGTGCNNNNDDQVNANNGSTTSASTQGTFNNQDKMFIDSAYISNLAEIHEGQLAASKGTNDSVRAFGNRMVVDHTAANVELLGLAKAKNVTPASNLDSSKVIIINNLSALSGQQFDLQYMTEQVADHQSAINLYQNEVNNTSGDPAVRGYASSNLPILNTHLQSAQSILNTLNGGTGTTSGSTSGTTSGTTGSTTSGSTTSSTTSGTTTSGSTSGTTSGSTSGTTSGSTSGTTSGSTSGTTSGSTSGSSTGSTGAY